MHAPAEQVVDRLPQRLAADVPEREFDRRDGAVEDRAAARVLVAIHRLDQPLDIERRGAEHIACGHMVDGGGDRARLPLHRALAEPREAGVGVHAGEHEIVPLVADQEHFDAGDFHALPPDGGFVSLCRIHKYIIFRSKSIEFLCSLDRIIGLQPLEERILPIGPDGQEFQPFPPRQPATFAGTSSPACLRPGAWLKTEELAARYGVSANPVREALWRLQGEGFVVANPNQGARVRAVDDDFVRNIFEIREAIEPIIVRRFCQRATPGDLDRLRAAAAAFADVAADTASDFEALEAANRDFHAIILEGEFNMPAIEAMERYAGIINATRAKLPVTPVAPARAGRAAPRDRRGDRVGRRGGGRAGRDRPCPGRRRGHAHPDAAGADDRSARGETRRSPSRAAPGGRPRTPAT